MRFRASQPAASNATRICCWRAGGRRARTEQAGVERLARRLAERPVDAHRDDRDRRFGQPGHAPSVDRQTRAHQQRDRRQHAAPALLGPPRPATRAVRRRASRRPRPAGSRACNAPPAAKWAMRAAWRVRSGQRTSGAAMSRSMPSPTIRSRSWRSVMRTGRARAERPSK